MKIAFIYDDQNDYCISNRLEYADFCLEDEASLIINSLKQLGHKVYVIKGIPNLKKNILELTKIDFVFNKTEGYKSRNREGLIPAICEVFGVPYSGTDSYGFSLSLNKYHTKLIANNIKIPTPNFCLIENECDYYKINNLRFPVIIKPNCEGSSMGCEVFYENNSNLLTSIGNLLKKYQQPVLVEEYISGIDISVPILGTGNAAQCLGIVEFSNSDGTYPEIASTKFKYIDHYITSILHREPHTEEIIRGYSLAIYKALGCKDYGRIDFRLNGNTPYFLEINPLPTLCENGAFDICAKTIGLNMVKIIERIIESALIS